MLYKLKEKWNRRYFVILAFAILALLTVGIYFILEFLYNQPASPYQEAYYFLIKGAYIPLFFLALVDIVISVIRYLMQEGEYSEMIREMGDLLIIAVLCLVMVFRSPITLGRFTLVLCDIPNMITGNTKSVTTRNFNIQEIDEKQETRSNTYHEYHYYVWINADKYMVSDNLEAEDLNRMVDDYFEDMTNGRPEKLDAGTYEITYLPVSRCILRVDFHKDGI